VHRMLTRIAAVRSSAEILSDYDEIPTERRDRFVAIIHEESQALSDVGEALAVYFHKADEPDRVLTPLDEVEALFEARGNRFEEIDRAASLLWPALTGQALVSRRQEAGALAREKLGGVIERVIEIQPQIETGAARTRALRALGEYAVDAVLMPDDRFAARAAELRYDVEALADAFSVETEAVLQRLTALPPGDDVPRFGCYRANASGTLIAMRGLEGLALPRYAAACPLWVLFRAQQSPESVIRQRALFPSGARFVFVARARNTGPTGFGKPRHYITDMIAMTEGDAHHTVYAPDASVPVEEVGPGCRLCPRHACPHRVEDPLTG